METKYQWLSDEEAIIYRADDAMRETQFINESFAVGDKVTKKELRSHIERLTSCVYDLKEEVGKWKVSTALGQVCIDELSGELKMIKESQLEKQIKKYKKRKPKFTVVRGTKYLTNDLGRDIIEALEAKIKQLEVDKKELELKISKSPILHNINYQTFMRLIRSDNLYEDS